MSGLDFRLAATGFTADTLYKSLEVRCRAMSRAPRIVIFRHLSDNWTVTDGWTAELASEIERRLPSATVEVAETVDEMKAAVADAEAAVTLELPPELLNEIDALSWVQALSAGVDGYNLERLREEDVVLTSASGVHSKPVAQHVFGYLLAFERGLTCGMEQRRNRTWEPFQCDELTNKTLGIVGLGNIGRRVAEVGTAFGMSVVGTKRTPNVEIDAVDQILPPEGIDEVLDAADYLVLSFPLTDETRGLIDKDFFDRLDESAIMVNVARGPVVDEAALVKALKMGEIRAAGLDVFEEEPLPEESPLWDLPNVIMTPHVAGSGPYYWERCADIVAENYPRFADGDIDAMINRVL
jgi:phosphoglycerate dehydrogenase-like enzyme